MDSCLGEADQIMFGDIRHTTSQAQRQITILLCGFYQSAFINLFSVSQPHKHAVQAACSTFWEAYDKRSSEDSKNFSLEKQEFKITLIIYFEVERFQMSQVLWIKEQIFMTISFFYRSRKSFLERKTRQKRHHFFFFFFSFRNTHFDNSYLQDISRNSLCNFPTLCLNLNAQTKSKARNLKEESLKTYVNHQRRKNSGRCQRYAQKKILKSSWFLLRVSELPNWYVFARRAAMKLTK